jgi:bleomycin hydrolase
MKKIFLLFVSIVFFMLAWSQNDVPQTVKPRDPNGRPTIEVINDSVSKNFIIEKSIAATPVKDQGRTGTCWAFSTTSLIESQCLKQNTGELDLSEMFAVRNTYIEKAKNYIMRQGHTQFGEGALGHDLIKAIAKYGAVPEKVYSGLVYGNTDHNHVRLLKKLQVYLDSVLKANPIPDNWLQNYEGKLNEELGAPPAKFTYNGKEYSPKSFAADVLQFNADDYVNITSFTHHPYFEPFIIEVPDNFSNGAYYNLPLDEMLQVTKEAVRNGYSVMWDADVSNVGFQQRMGTAANFNNLPEELKRKGDLLTGEAKDGKWDADIRQHLFENLTTQDDHLMHIVGLEKSKSGATFFLVKNSWGDVGPKHGYINVSEGYFAINTISLVIPKAALNKKVLEKLKIK